jgi:hypothetical protein
LENLANSTALNIFSPCFMVKIIGLFKTTNSLIYPLCFVK